MMLRYTPLRGSAPWLSPIVPTPTTPATAHPTALSFSDPDHTYEEFETETIALHPEAEARLEYTLAVLERLVADRARIPIRSQEKLREYYLNFRLISC